MRVSILVFRRKLALQERVSTTTDLSALRTQKILSGVLLLFTCAKGVSVAQSKPEEVIFPSGGRELHGFLWKPEGIGPFPAITAARNFRALSQTSPDSTPRIPTSSSFRIAEDRVAPRGTTFRIWSHRCLRTSGRGVWWSFSRPRSTM